MQFCFYNVFSYPINVLKTRTYRRLKLDWCLAVLVWACKSAFPDLIFRGISHALQNAGNFGSFFELFKSHPLKIGSPSHFKQYPLELELLSGTWREQILNEIFRLYFLLLNLLLLVVHHNAVLSRSRFQSVSVSVMYLLHFDSSQLKF